MAPSISVVIPACCRADRHGSSRLRLTLTSLAHQSLPKDDFEVIVVDDGSDPPLAGQVAGWDLSCDVSVVRRDNGGMASAYNVGIVRAQAPYVLLGIDDEMLSPRALEAHLHAHQDGQRVVFGRTRFLLHTRVFTDVISGRLAPGVDVDAGSAGDPVTTSDVAEGFDDLIARSRTLPQFEDFERVLASGRCHELRVGWLAMRVGNHSVSAEVLGELGGVDEMLDRHAGWYLDLDLGLRFQQAGLEFRLAEESVSVNVDHPRSGHGVDEMMSGLAYLYSKHRRMDVVMCPMYFDRRLPLLHYTRGLQASADWWPA